MERLLTEDGIFVIDNGASTFIPLWSYMVENQVIDILMVTLTPSMEVGTRPPAAIQVSSPLGSASLQDSVVSYAPAFLPLNRRAGATRRRFTRTACW